MLVPSVFRLFQHYSSARDKNNDIGSQRTPNNFPCAPPSFQEYCGHGFRDSAGTYNGEEMMYQEDPFKERFAGSHSDPNSCESPALLEWLSRSDVTTWPHVLRCKYAFGFNI